MRGMLCHNSESNKYLFFDEKYLQLVGDPKPIVVWHRENGNLPEGRSRVLLDNTLRIEDARPEDQGRYVCKAHNEGGNVSVAVLLFVYGKIKIKIYLILIFNF